MAVLSAAFETFGVELTVESKAVPTTHAVDFESAKPIFLLGQKCAMAATKYFTLDGHVTDYIEIQQDLSKLYQGLAAFNKDPDDQCG